MVGRRRRLSAIAAFRLYSDQCDWIGRPRCARKQPTFVTRSASTTLRQRAGLARFTADQHLPGRRRARVRRTLAGRGIRLDCAASRSRLLHMVGMGRSACRGAARGPGLGRVRRWVTLLSYWLTALERLLTRKQVLSATDLDRRRGRPGRRRISRPHMVRHSARRARRIFGTAHRSLTSPQVIA
jgi:hypothetical protein